MSWGSAFAALPHRTARAAVMTHRSQSGLAQLVAVRCPSRTPGFECVDLTLPGYHQCCLGHSLIPGRTPFAGDGRVTPTKRTPSEPSSAEALAH